MWRVTVTGYEEQGPRHGKEGCKKINKKLAGHESNLYLSNFFLAHRHVAK